MKVFVSARGWRSRLALAGLVLCLFPLAPAAEQPWQVPPWVPVAFVNVNVVPMDSEGVLERYTVVVRDGRIAEMGPAGEFEAPPDAERIEAEGLYLMPGLADMHTHFVAYNPYWENDLFLFLANGVTTVREMWGGPQYLRWREAVRDGWALGPALYLASPGMDGPGGPFAPFTPAVAWPEHARWLVASYKDAGYDFIKVYSSLTLDVYDAILEEAAAQGIRVIGHVPSRVGLHHAMAAGQYSAEHLSFFGPLVASRNSVVTGEIDDAKLAALAEVVRDSDLWNVATIAIQAVTWDRVPALRERPEMRYLSPYMKRWFDEPVARAPDRDSTRHMANLRLILKALHDAGAKLMLGVDSGFRYVLPGFSIHDELLQAVEAGLTPYQALRLGTVNAAEFLGMREEMGAVAPGMHADLILLEANPLEDVGHVSRRAGVMVRGRWLSEAFIQERLEDFARTYGQ